MAISVSSPADFHVHLRQGHLTELTVPHVREGGFHLAYIMVRSSYWNAALMKSHVLMQPNLKPPITTTEKALKYKAKLERIDSNVDYLMTLYLSPELTPEEIRKASAAGIVGMSTGLDDWREGF